MIMMFLFNLCFANEPIVLAPGTSTEILVPRNQTVRIEKTAVVRLLDLGSKLRIIGKKIGSSQIKIGTDEKRVSVVKTSTYNTYQKLRLWQKNKRGPSLSFENNQLQIRGRILTFEDWMDLSRYTDENDSFFIKASVSQELKTRIEFRLKELLEENNLAFSYLAVEPTWTLTLAQTSGEELKNYQRILYPHGIQIKASPQAIKTIPLVEVSIVAAEIQRTEMSRLGIQWPSATSFQVLPQWNTPKASIIATLNHLEEMGKGRVLAKPTLLSQSGEEATFHSGGEFPIKTMNQFQANVAWKKYGLILKIKPRADHRGKMDLQIDCEFSSLDSREDDAGVPGLIVHRVTSHLNLEQSKTIALSGLIKDEWRKSRSGLPWLLKIPILSPLFSSQSYQNNQSELIFFVTPKVVR